MEIFFRVLYVCSNTELDFQKHQTLTSVQTHVNFNGNRISATLYYVENHNHSF